MSSLSIVKHYDFIKNQFLYVHKLELEKNLIVNVKPA